MDVLCLNCFTSGSALSIGIEAVKLMEQTSFAGWQGAITPDLQSQHNYLTAGNAYLSAAAMGALQDSAW